MSVTTASNPPVSPIARSSGVSLGLAFKFALRELRGGLSGFYIFLACIALGVGAISGVNAVALSITQGISEEGRTLLGGDAAFTTVQRQLSTEERAFLSQRATLTEAATMRAMARLPDGSDQSLIELKAVDTAWPLLGVLKAEPETASGQLSDPNTIIVDPVLLSRLNVNVGDTVNIGRAQLKIVGTIVDEPDRVSDGFAVGPKVIVSRAALDESGLIQPGSLINWTVRALLPSAEQDVLREFLAEARTEFPDAGWRIRSRDRAAPALASNVTRFSQFLTLVGLTALIVGGVGVANAVRAFLATKTNVIASFKSLGAPAWFVFAVYIMQILLLASLGIVIGLIIGGTLPIVAQWALQGIIPVGSASAFQPSAMFSAIAYGVLTALAFALWPLGQARDVPATALFRNGSRDDAGWPRASYQIATAVVVLALMALAIYQAGDQRIAFTFVGGIAFSFILLRLVARLIQWIAKKAPQVRSTPLRLAIGNIHRPGALTPSVVLSLGLGLALLVSLALIDTNLRQQISGNLPQKAPDFFFVDIQSAEYEAFEKKVAEIAPEGTVETSPMLRGRIVSINNVPATQIQAKESGRWVLRGDRGITFEETLPEGATLTDGEWWDANYSGPPLVSFAAEEADEVGVNVGDKITINVLGRNIAVTVANLRAVEWQSLSINFVMVFSPNTFAGAPYARLATLQLPDAPTGEDGDQIDVDARDGQVLKEITNAFPTVTTVRVRDALSAVNGLIAQLATAIRAAALLALIASILVLGGALAAGNQARVHDAVVLKTLGATRRTLIGAFVLEYTILGLATALFALVAGTAASWFVIDRIMGFNFTFSLAVASLTMLGALVLTVGFGLIGTWRVLGQKAAPVLRTL
ncbi:MAG: ABC transporter permease [Pseudomonadota bacterium]